MSPSNTPKNPDQSNCRNKKPHVACVQCRERKVRCSGSFPCANCSRRSVECVFEPEDRKIIVSENYFNELKRKAGEDGNSQPAKKRHASDKSPREQHTSLGEASYHNADANCDLGADSGDENFSALTNPLVMTPSQVVTDTAGRTRFLGPSSTWAYSRHIMGMIKQHLNHNLSPDVPLNVDGAAFPIQFPSTGRLGLSISMEGLPSLDYALYLTNTVKFHVGQTYHLFHEQTFMQKLFALYKDGPEPLNATNRMWFVQFFLVMALGMALLARGVSTTSPPGRDYFIRAVDLFPDINGLYQDTITSVEVCCGLALYLQSVDHRNSAYVYLGLGLRVALSQGYHRDVVSDLDVHTDMTRHRNVWWTLYILDRKFSSLIGAPSSVHDRDISVPLPMYQKSTQKTCALDMHVRLSRLLAKVLNTVYCVDGRLNSSFLKNIQVTVRELAELAVELNATPELKLNNSGPVSRLSATLNLCYHQCMVLATRPLLVCLLHDRLDRRANKTRHATIIIDPVKALLKTSHDSAQKSLRILATLQAQGLLEYFLPFDLDHAFSAGFVLSLISVINPDSVDVNDAHLERTFCLLDTLIAGGKVPAGFRRQELAFLHDMLRCLKESDSDTCPQETARSGLPLAGTYDLSQQGVSPNEMLALASLLDGDSTLHLDSEVVNSWLWEAVNLVSMPLAENPEDE